MLNGEITASAAGTWQLADKTINRMGFGSMRLTVDPDPERAIRTLRTAVDLGVNHIDTAAFYFSPGGVLEVGTGATRYATELIKRALAPYDERLLIATKVGPGILPSGEWGEARTAGQLRHQVEENLRRLGLERLDLVNLRVFRGADSIGERFAALDAMRDEGLIGHLGLSAVRKEQLAEAEAIAPVACVQNSFSVDNRRSQELVEICGRRGIAFVPFFAIAGGGREAGPGAGQGSAAMDAVARRHGVTAHQVRLAWTLHQGAHVLAIPGTGSVEHLRENVAAGAITLSGEDLAAMEKAMGKATDKTMEQEKS